MASDGSLFRALVQALYQWLRGTLILYGHWIRRFLRWWAVRAPGMFYSFWLHAVLLLFLIGLPLSCNTARELEPHTVTVALLPVKDMTNVQEQIKKLQEKPKEEPKEKPKEKPKPKEEPKPEPKVAPKPTPKPEALKKPVPKPKEKPKEKPKKKEDPELDFNTVLKSVEKIKEEKETKRSDNAKDIEKSLKSSQFQENLALSISEIDAIKQQISKCWNIPAGARDAKDISVQLRIELRRDGSVSRVDIIDKKRYADASQTFYKAAADSAMRAVYQCSPLKGLPAEKHDNWREIELNFDPRELLY